MSTPHISELPALRSAADVHERVSQLVGAACGDRRLWIMFVDGDGVQAPVMMPIDDMPATPDPEIVDRLGDVLGSLRDDLRTARGPGSVVLTWERQGSDRPSGADRNWVRALTDACLRGRVDCRGTFLSTPGGVAAVS